MPGFGPLGARASTTRPSATTDSYGVQTWAKDCSAPGASDGTVVDASWINQWIANWLYAAAQAGVTITNDQSNDTFIWQIIQAAVADGIAAAGGTISGGGGGGSGWNLV